MTRYAIASLAIMVALPAYAVPAPHYSKMEPARGELPAGKSVLVDDGTCPAGMIKEVTGGDVKSGASRSRRCISR